jgi:hypothetical protein
LTFDEGTKFRNCVTKYSAWLPTLRSNLVDSSYAQNCQRLHELENRSDAEFMDDRAEFAKLGNHYQQ